MIACDSARRTNIIRPRNMYIEAASKAGARSRNKVWMRYGPRVQFGDSRLDMARPIYPSTSTAQVSIPCSLKCLRFPTREGSLTYAANHKREKEPSSGSDHLVQMKECCAGEKNDEDNSTRHTRVIVIKGK